MPGSEVMVAPGTLATQEGRFPPKKTAATVLFPPPQQFQQAHGLALALHRPPPDNDLPQDPIKITSNFVGVHWHRGASKSLKFFLHMHTCWRSSHAFLILYLDKWVAQISLENKRTHLGYFKTEIEAAVRYDKTANEHGR